MKNPIIQLAILLITCVACSSDSNNNDNTLINTPPIASNYIEPLNNQICTGIEVTETTMQVNFKWNNYIDAEDPSLSYKLNIINLSNDIVEEIDLTTNYYTSILNKGTTYSWNVSAIDSGGESVIGLTWVFQTPFEAYTNYTPFPALMISPNNGEILYNNMVTLEWEGNDPDQGETEQLLYDVYLSNSNPPFMVSTNQINLSYTESLSSGVYYWMIVSKDQNNNSSDSQVRQFTIN